MKTVRFSQVVARSGQPEPYTLWADPATDRVFQTALKQNRVMSVHQETVGTAKDFGEIGLAEDRHVSLLVFPRSLKEFAGCRVVGVKYELLSHAPPKDPVKVTPKAPARRKPAPSVVEPPPPPAAEKTIPEIRIWRKDEPEQAPTKATPLKTPVAPSKPVTQPALAQLTKEVRRAMKQLQDGKAVAAYQTLQKALGEP